MEKREKFSSRLGFILISAGCAIGLGNVWRFPYITGQYGGGAFVLIYLFFLLVLGLPIVIMEFAVGRASQKSVAQSYEVLEPKGTKWHIHKYFAIAFADDVLYNRRRLDGSLFCKDGKRRICGSGCGKNFGNFYGVDFQQK